MLHLKSIIRYIHLKGLLDDKIIVVGDWGAIGRMLNNFMTAS